MSTTGERQAFCIIAEGKVIQQLPRETAVTIVGIDDLRGMPMSKVVHIGQIGCCFNVVSPGIIQTSDWIINDNDLLNMGQDLSHSYNDDGHNFLVRHTTRVPEEFQPEELAGYSSFDEFLQHHPDRSSSLTTVEDEFLFSHGIWRDLISYKHTQQDEGVSGKIENTLKNNFQSIPGVQFPVIKSSEWVGKFSEQVVESRRINVVNINFNPIDDGMFEVNGLGVPDRTDVRDIRESLLGDLKVVMDGEVVPPEVGVFAETRSSVPSRQSRLFLLAINLVAIFAIAIFLLYRLWFRKKSFSE